MAETQGHSCDVIIMVTLELVVEHPSAVLIV